MSGDTPRRSRACRLCIASLIGGCALATAAERSAVADEDAGGARLVAICTSCHRLDGRRTGIRSILVWEAEEIVDKIRDARSDERANNAMRAVSLSLSDEEIAAVADRIAALGKKPGAR